MNTALLVSILVINVVFLFAVWLWFIVPVIKKKKLRNFDNPGIVELSELRDEVKRQKIIINDYKEKLQFRTDSDASKIKSYAPEADIEKLRDVLNDKQKLEKEKEAFKEKTRKLWEQSLAVYKEKERIDKLRKYIESRHASLTQSIQYALRIQQALLPSPDILDQVFPNNFILYRPRNIVSGDFYWIRQINNKTFLVAADCTGHGVPGAFMSLLGIFCLNEITSEHVDLSASFILEEMRIKIKSSFKKDDGNISIQDGMDMAICIINHDTNELEFSGANNGIFIARKDKSLVEVKGTRNPISYYRKERPFENHIIKMEADESVFMYSDGYFDQTDSVKKEKIKRSGFKKILEECIQNDLPLTGFKEKLEGFLDEWQGDSAQIDDILVLGITCFSDKSEVEFF